MADEIQDPINFIIQQQAQFWADIQSLRELQAGNSLQIGANSRQIEANAGMIRQLVDVSLSLANALKQLGTDTDRRIKELSEVQAHSDRRLDALIGVVDKLVRHNGSKGTS